MPYLWGVFIQSDNEFPNHDFYETVNFIRKTVILTVNGQHNGFIIEKMNQISP